jgi:hypothetical protein
VDGYLSAIGGGKWPDLTMPRIAYE